MFGDKGVGKTALLYCYATDEFTIDYNPTSWDHYEAPVEVENHKFKIEFWDLNANKEDENMRKYCASKSKAFIICFNMLGNKIMNKTGFIQFNILYNR